MLARAAATPMRQERQHARAQEGSTEAVTAQLATLVLRDITAPKTRSPHMATPSAQRAPTARPAPLRQRLAPRVSTDLTLGLRPAQVAPVALLGIHRVLGMLAVTRKALAAISIFRAGHAL
jgi:hypothetical protein